MSGFGIILLLIMGLIGLILLIQGLAAWDRFLEQGGFRTALDRLAYVNREPVYTPQYVPQKALPAPVQEPILADTDAIRDDTPPRIDTEIDRSLERIDSEDDKTASRAMKDIDLIVLLAVQKKDGRERWSANSIAKFVGGSHNDVMDIISAVRKTAQFPEMTPEQAATRQQLALEK